jgi:hypothetical protein
LAAARHRALLRIRVEICTALRRRQVSAPVGAALAAALRLGDEAAAELALIPDTPERRRGDAVLLGAGAARTEFEARMSPLVAAYRDGRPLDLFTASPAELLACCVARAGLDLASA